MRFLLIVGALALCCYYAFSGKSAEGKPLTASLMTSVVSSTLGDKKHEQEKKDFPDAPTPSPPPNASFLGSAGNAVQGLVSPFGSTAMPGMTSPPSATRSVGSYQFQHRALPAAEWFTALTPLGVVVFTDPVTRSVTVSGNEEPVKTAMEAMKAIDQVPGSCALHAWCLYVDKTQTKGWDLLGAIRAVSDVDFAVRMVPGALAFDLRSADLSAALDVICDGVMVEVLQNPQIRLTNGYPATIEATQEIPIPQTTVSNGLAQTSIDFRKVGLQFKVDPQFLGRDRVRLQVTQANGVVGSPTKIDGDEIPVIETQTVSSTAELSIGESMLLGGVKTNRTRRAKGLFRDTLEQSEGTMYVIISLVSETPRAVVPEPTPVSDPLPWIECDPMVLPPKPTVKINQK